MPRAASVIACLTGLVVSIAAIASACAQPRPAPIATLEAQGVTIVKRFDAPGGLTGFAARAGRRPITLYLTPDGRHVIVGTLLDAQGNNLSQPQLDAAITQPTREQAWPRLEKTAWIGDGDDDAPRTIYVFTDPNCPYCHKFYKAARPWVKAGRVQLRHIMVGLLKPSSRGKAAALLGADDPEAAMNRHERRYRRGGIAPMDDIPKPLRAKLAANQRLMTDLGIRGTPGIVYRDDDGVQILQGLPQGAALSEVLGPK